MISIVNRFRPSKSESPSTGNAKMIDSSRRIYLLRALVVIACIGIGFADTFRLLAYGLRVGAAGYSVLVLMMSFVLFVGLDRKRARALNIHDREVDYIIGGLAVLLAITIKAQLLPRFLEWESILRLDYLAMIVLAFGVCGLIFGMRSTLNYGPGWILLFCYNAPVFLMVSVAFGNGYWGTTTAEIIGMSLAVMVASNRDVVQSIYFGLLNFGFGLIFAAAMYFATNGSRYLVHIPIILALITVVLLSTRGDLRQWMIHRREPTVKNTKPALGIIVVVTLVLAYFPVPGFQYVMEFPQAGPQTASAPGMQVSRDWEVVGATEYPWASRFFGPNSTLLRQRVVAREYNPEWDLDGRNRTVMVDSLRTKASYQARTFGNETLYSTLSGRRSDYQDVDLGYGITGQVYEVLDETDFLSYTKLVFEWRRGDGTTEKVTVIAVDDHRPEAKFPQLVPSIPRMFIQVLTVLFRGNAVTRVQNPELKDLGLVTEVAQGIVQAEMEHS